MHPSFILGQIPQPSLITLCQKLLLSQRCIPAEEVADRLVGLTFGIKSLHVAVVPVVRMWSARDWRSTSPHPSPRWDPCVGVERGAVLTESTAWGRGEVGTCSATGGDLPMGMLGPVR